MSVQTQPEYSYRVETMDLRERPRRFLEAFAAILKHSYYRPILDLYARLSAKCALCTASCPVYEVTGDPKDIPCYRSELLIRVYRRYCMLGGILKPRLLDSFWLTDDYMVDPHLLEQACEPAHTTPRPERGTTVAH